MVVGELRNLLKDVPYNTLVMLSRDAEGNGFSGLWEVDLTDFDISYMEPLDKDEPESESVVKVVLLWADR